MPGFSNWGVDRAGNIWTLAYDGSSRLETIRNPFGNVQRMAIPGDISAFPQLWLVTTFSYDSNNLTQVQNPWARSGLSDRPSTLPC